MIRHAAGMSPEEMSLEQARVEGHKGGRNGYGRSMNPYQSGSPEHSEWELGRMDGLRYLLPQPTRRCA